MDNRTFNLQRSHQLRTERMDAAREALRPRNAPANLEAPRPKRAYHRKEALPCAES
jgi:hypothetical protein